jgi:hypothetical protein
MNAAQKIAELIAKHGIDSSGMDAAHNVYGIRFDDRDLSPGEKIGPSKYDPNREEVQHPLPGYGSEEYNALPELPGACAYGLDSYSRKIAAREIAQCPGCRVYLVKGKYAGYADDDMPEDGEITLRDCQVVEAI